MYRFFRVLVVCQSCSSNGRMLPFSSTWSFYLSDLSSVLCLILQLLMTTNYHVQRERRHCRLNRVQNVAIYVFIDRTFYRVTVYRGRLLRARLLSVK